MAGNEPQLENPLDAIGTIAREGGELAGKGFGLVGKYLTQLTGDSFTAALFAVFLLFTLMLLRGAASSRNSPLYSGGVAVIGGLGLVVTLLASIGSHGGKLVSLFRDNPERDFLYKGLTGYSFESEYKIRFIILELPNILSTHKWYAFIFLNMLVVGLILLAIHMVLSRGQKSAMASRPGMAD